jgi:outer membrane protein OmpA-like peptidoglycan-associated protein
MTVMALAWALTAAPVWGQQRAGQFEFGAFGAFARYDGAFNLDDPFGGGTRFGYFVTDNLGIEAEVLFLSQLGIPGTSSSFEPVMGGGSVLLNLPVANLATLYILGGYSRLDFATTAPYKFTDGGMHAGAGVRLSLSQRVAIRVEGRAIFTPETNASFGTSVRHLVASAGFSVFHYRAAVPAERPAPPPPVAGDADRDGVADTVDACAGTPAGAAVDARGCQRDTDADHVPDGRDACPGTPLGATVDAGGCPADRDGDGVYDGLDQCPETPAGARVDSVGCPADGDGDGVYDGPDECPDTPPGAAVNARGCAADADADRVPDGLDQCPDTPLGATVDRTGCPLDGDGDRVFDGLDQCPGSAAGAVVDAAGCESEVVRAVVDSDGDGVLDPADRCPATPAGAQVDATGCVVLFREEAGAKATPLVLEGVTFTSGRSVITPESHRTLDAVAASLVANPDVRIEVAGHTDNTGSAAINQRLSQARAAAVRAYLARKGVAPVRMVARGYGPNDPVAPNTTAEGRARNRRVELRRIE